MNDLERLEARLKGRRTYGWTAQELAEWLESGAGPEVGPFNREEDERRIVAIVTLLRQVPLSMRVMPMSGHLVIDDDD